MRFCVGIGGLCVRGVLCGDRLLRAGRICGGPCRFCCLRGGCCFCCLGCLYCLCGFGCLCGLCYLCFFCSLCGPCGFWCFSWLCCLCCLCGSCGWGSGEIGRASCRGGVVGVVVGGG